MVALAGVFQTVLHNTPLIFLREAEVSHGQYDLELLPGEFTNNFALNYTKIAALAADGGDEFSYSSPRYELGGSIIAAKRCSGHESDTPDMDNMWAYNASQCFGNDPFQTACVEVNDVNLVLIDSVREAAMKLGRSWSIKGQIPPGSVVIAYSDANRFGVRVGDTVFLVVDIPYTIRHAMRPYVDYNWDEWSLFCGRAYLPFTVHGLYTSASGKFPSGLKRAVVAEYSSFLAHAAPRIHPMLRAADPSFATPPNQGPAERASIANHTLYEYAPKVLFNFPPKVRLNKYINSNYFVIQEGVVEFTSNLLYLIGFNDVDTDVPILKTLQSRQFVSIFLGLLLNVILFVLFALCCILIYSLMTINVQKRTFELAVRRLVGYSRRVLVGMLSFQSFMYSLPAWVIGLILARILTALVMRQFTSLSGLPASSNLTREAIAWATALAFAVSIIASIGPIYSAMSSSLRDALDFDRPKSTAVKYEIERAEDRRISWAVVAVGTGLALFGFAIYYLIPLSLLSLNLQLFINVFFWILMAALIGMVMIAMNVEILVEKLLAKLLLFWERKVVVSLAVSNLIAHRIRNRKTMVMYALALAFIVFITVAANQQIQIAQFRQMRDDGAPISIATQGGSEATTVRAVEDVLTSPDVARFVTSYSWMARDFRAQTPDVTTSEVMNYGRIYDWGVTLRGVMPTFFDSVYSQFLKIGSQDRSSLPLPEAMYTTRGSQGFVLSATMDTEIGASRNTEILFSTETAGGTLRTPVNTHALMEQGSYLEFSKYPSQATDGFTSMPTMIRLLHERGYNVDMRSLAIERLFINVKSSASTADQNYVKAQLSNALLATGSSWFIIDNTDALDSLQVTITILNLIFSVLTAVAMFLCFFSLLASMLANINEQQKEIGVLLAIGLNRGALVRVYVHESLILVLAASFMGAAIGVVTATIFTMQQSLFTQMPSQFGLPWLIIILVAIVSALLSAVAPARRLTSTSITKLLRNVY